MNIKNVLKSTLKSKLFKVLGAISTSVLLALTVLEGIKAVNETYFNLANFPLFGAILFLIVFVISLIKTIIKFYSKEEPARVSYINNDISSKIFIIVVQKIKIIIDSEIIEKIILTHTNNLNSYFQSLEKGAKEKISNDDFDRLLNFYEIENEIRKEYRACFDELNNYLIDLINKNEQIKEFSNYRSFDESSNYDEKQFQINLEDIRNQIKEIKDKLEKLNLEKPNINEGIAVNLGLSATFVTLGLPLENAISFLDNNIVADEIKEQIVYEILENALIFLPDLGATYAIVKLFRFLYKLKVNSEKIENLKNTALHSVTKKLHAILAFSLDKTDKDCRSFMKELLQKFEENYKDAQRNKKEAELYL